MWWFGHWTSCCLQIYCWSNSIPVKSSEWAPGEAGRTFDAGNINEGLGLLRGKRGLKHPGRRVGNFMEFHNILGLLNVIPIIFPWWSTTIPNILGSTTFKKINQLGFLKLLKWVLCKIGESKVFSDEHVASQLSHLCRVGILSIQAEELPFVYLVWTGNTHRHEGWFSFCLLAVTI